MKFGVVKITAKPFLTIPIYLPFAKILLAGSLTVVSACAASHELSLCGERLRQAVKGNFDQPVSSSACPVTANLIEWLHLQQPGKTFAMITAFLHKNPSWPLKEKLQVKAEATLTGEENSRDIIRWFNSNPPLSAKGTEVYARALIINHKENLAAETVRKAWQQFDFTPNHLKSFCKEFSAYLTAADHDRRVERLLMAQDIAAVQFMYPWLSRGSQLLADARMALIGQAGDVDARLAQVPANLRRDSGLVYDHLKWYRRTEQNSQMLKLFLQTPQPASHQALWWRERNLLVRRLMDEHRYKDAYRLVSQHGLSEGEDFANGEWLAGWLALRMLGKPESALMHFKKLQANVKSPISVSRAAYWCARACQALGRKQEASQWMAEARTFPGTYYGQVALRGGLKGKMPLLHFRRPRADTALHQKFANREFVRVIQLLCAVKAKHLIEPFGMKLFKEITNPGEQIFLVELAAKECSPYLAIVAAKKMPLKNVPLIEAAYPLLPRHYHNEIQSANPSLVHAIIRQESRFKADAISPAGAQGLMQLMPRTALHTAQKIRNYPKAQGHSKQVKKGRLGGSALGKTLGGSLADPDVNIPLGCAHLRDLLDKYNGSLILTIAAYNAGGKAVDKWLEQYGDPRNPQVDLIDWVETIPFAETRNYVQRVLENYAWYKQRLGK